MYTDKVLLITGGTGSFGNAVLAYFLKTDIKEIRIFSRDEKKQYDMKMRCNDPRIRFFLGDVRDSDSMDYPMTGTDFIFHAAAFKQIPSTELFPMEAVKTNIIGTDNVLAKAIEHKVKKVVCLSTDKSVYPISAMGISKAMMEKVIIARSRITDTTTITCVRYGNVLASRGSVIPLFISQIKEGKHLTVTDVSMTRFMMSLNNAIELVLFAFENGKPGDIFVQKAPSASIGQIVHTLLKIFKAVNPITIIGARAGDKVHETLVTSEEYAYAVDMGNYFKIPTQLKDLAQSASHPLNKEEFILNGYRSDNTRKLPDDELEQLLRSLDITQA